MGFDDKVKNSFFREQFVISHNGWQIPEVLRVGDNPFVIAYMVGEEFGWRPTGREPGIC